MKTIFTIHKLDCHSCAMVMEGICEDTAGVTKAEVNSRQRVLKVEHDQSVNPGDLKKTLDEQGYPVDMVA